MRPLLALALTCLAVAGHVARDGAAYAGSCRTPVAIAHRGTHPAGVDENTLSAFERAARAGHDVETDVWPDAEGRLWLMHDRNLRRTTGHDVEIDSLSSQQVASLRYTAGGSPLLAFESFVTWLVRHPGVSAYVEPKKRLHRLAPGRSFNVAERIAARLAAAGVARRAWITHHNTVAGSPHLRTRFASVHLLHKADAGGGDSAELARQGYDTVAVRAPDLTRGLVTAYHRSGIAVQGRNTVRPHAWRRAVRAGVDAQLTNDPDGFAALCSRRHHP